MIPTDCQLKLTFPNHNQIQLHLYKLARYITMVIANTEKIDQIKADLFHQQLPLNQLFHQIDFARKGYIDSKDLINLVQKNGADKKAFQMERIFRYFGANNNRISKIQFLKAITLPPWKITKARNSSQKVQKIFFKFLVCVYVALEQDDSERMKLKDIEFMNIFTEIAHQSQQIKINQLSDLIVDKKFKKPDAFGLLRFMHNKIQVNFQQFEMLFKNNLPQRFQEAKKDLVMVSENKPKSSVTARYEKKYSNYSELTLETNNGNQKDKIRNNQTADKWPSTSIIIDLNTDRDRVSTEKINHRRNISLGE